MRYIFKNKFYTFIISITDFLGNIAVFVFGGRKRQQPGNVGNILLIRLDHIGDVLFSTPVPENLKGHYNGAKVTFLVGSASKGIILDNPYVDEVICYDAPWFDRGKRRLFEFKRFLKLAKELRAHNYDIGLDLRGDFRHILLMALAGVRYRVGYGISGGAFLLHKEADYDSKAHILQHNLGLLRSMDIKIIADRPCLYNSEGDKRSACEFLSSNNISDSDFLVTIHASAGYPSKNWLDKRFSELIKVLASDFKAKIILLGSDQDKERNNRIIKASSANAINAAGRTTLGALSALIKRSSAFIGVDSGPSQIASITNGPTVILYSGTNRLEEWGAVGDKTVLIQKDIVCKGCEKLDCADNICMDLISVEDVTEALKRAVGL